jgi:hypothetical protein
METESEDLEKHKDESVNVFFQEHILGIKLIPEIQRVEAQCKLQTELIHHPNV